MHAMDRALRDIPATCYRRAPQRDVLAALRELAQVSSYFAVTAGPAGDTRAVAHLYRDTGLLAEVVGQVAERIGTADRRVAVSTFFLGFAARLWSIGMGALSEHGLLIDLDPDQLHYAQNRGTVRLNLLDPVAWNVASDPPSPTLLPTRLADMVLDEHLQPLSVGLRCLGPISQPLLVGNAASAALGAARALHRYHGGDLAAEPGWALARALCADERLSGAICFAESGTEYRRRSCCLFYRTPTGGLCGDCALSRQPEIRRHQKGPR